MIKLTLREPNQGFVFTEMDYLSLAIFKSVEMVFQKNEWQQMASSEGREMNPDI